MQSLERTRIPAQSTRPGAEPRIGVTPAPPSTGDALTQPMKRGYTMMISQPALICLTATWQRLMRNSVREMEPAEAQLLEMPAPADAILGHVDAMAESSLMAAAAGEELAPLPREDGRVVPAAADVAVPLAANE